MEDAEKRQFSRLELAEYLEDLARQLRSRTLLVAGERFIVPEHLEGRVELKGKGGRLSLKLRFKWPKPLAAGVREGREAGGGLRPAAPAGTEAEGREALPGEFQEIKRQMGRLFAALLKEAHQGALPPARQVEEFLALCRASAALAEPDWETEMQEFLDHAENLLRASREGALEMFAHELRDLKNRMHACHLEYK